jgi:hypothetical protein
MRPTSTQERTVESTLGGKTVDMGFYKGAQRKLMSILTRMYSDLPGTLLREYSINALDSHIEAGTKEPVLVYLPNLMNQTLRIQDRGIGMSPEDVELRFSQYGYSSKEHTDDQTGYLGLGSKSALAYTESFTITAVKNGVKTVATMSRGKDGSGKCGIVDTSSTTEPDGVLITIPVKAVHPFEHAAKGFFRWWAPGTVLVNDAPPVAPEPTLVLNDKVRLYTRNELEDDYIIMGGIAYPVGTRLSGGISYAHRVAAEVPMGSVEFVPSREALEFTDRTATTIDRVKREAKVLVQQRCQDEMAQAKTPAEAIEVARRLSRLAPSLQWKGMEVPTHSVRVPFTSRLREFRLHSSRNAFLTASDISVTNPAGTLFITGFAVDTLTPGVRAKIRKYIEDKSITNVYLGEERPVILWLEGAQEVTYEDIKAVKLPRDKTARMPTQEFRVNKWVPAATGGHVGSEHRVLTAEDDNIVLVSPSYETTGYNMAYRYHERTFVTMAANRWAKFQREFPGTAETFEEFAKRIISQVEAACTDADIIKLTGNSDTFSGLRGLDPALFEDPEVVKLVTAAKDSPNESRAEEFYTVRRWFRTNLEAYPADIDAKRISHLLATLDKYPLLRYAGKVPAEHTADYVNALWAQEQE